MYEPSEFCEDNSVIRSAIDALKNWKNTYPFILTFLFLFEFFNLLLDAPRNLVIFTSNLLLHLDSYGLLGTIFRNLGNAIISNRVANIILLRMSRNLQNAPKAEKSKSPN